MKHKATNHVNDKGDRIRKIVQKIGNDESYTTLRVFVR
jgi:hypothetical protein